MNRQRIALWDNLKYFLIFLVVLGHMADQYQDSLLFRGIYMFIYAFHMPLFFFVSGLFHRNEQIARKVCTFLALGYVYKFLLFAVRSWLKEEVIFRYFRERGTPWFMFALAAFILLSYLLRDVNREFLLILFFLAACFLGYDTTVDSKLVMSRMIYFYPFYLLGEFMQGKEFLPVTRRRSIRCLSVLVLCLWMGVCFGMDKQVYELRDVFMGFEVADGTELRGQWLIRLTCYLITLLTGFSVVCLMPSRRIPKVTDFGRRTIQIYFWHRPILYVLADLHIVEHVCQSAAGRCLYLLSAVPFTFLLALAPFSFPTAQIQMLARRERSLENVSENAGKAAPGDDWTTAAVLDGNVQEDAEEQSGGKDARRGIWQR